MRRWLVRLLLIALLPWQGVAWASTALAGELHHDAQHAVAHWLGDAHHHHDHGDGGFHRDDSDESAQHMMQASAQTAPVGVLPVAPVCTAVLLEGVVPEGISLLHCPRPYLEGPRRPPRHIG